MEQDFFGHIRRLFVTAFGNARKPDLHDRDSDVRHHLRIAAVEAPFFHAARQNVGEVVDALRALFFDVARARRQPAARKGGGLAKRK